LEGKICDPAYDETTSDNQRGRYNRKLCDMVDVAPVNRFHQSTKATTAWTHEDRGENKTVKSVIEWKPLGMRPRGMLKKRWIDLVEDVQ